MEKIEEQYQIFRENSLTLAIYYLSPEGDKVPMNKETYDELCDEIREIWALFNVRDTVSTFVKNSHIRGVMKVRCATSEIKSFLEDIIEDVDPLWQNMQLCVNDFNGFMLQYKVLGIFPHCDLSNDQILRALSAVNQRLDFDFWTILSREITEKELRITFDIDEREIQLLKLCNFKLNFGAGMAIFEEIIEDEETRLTIQSPD